MGEENCDSIENIIYRYFLNRIYRVVRCTFLLFPFVIRFYHYIKRANLFNMAGSKRGLEGELRPAAWLGFDRFYFEV